MSRQITPLLKTILGRAKEALAAASKAGSNTSALIRDIVLAREITRVVVVTDIETDLDRADHLVNLLVDRLMTLVILVILVILATGAALGTINGAFGGKIMARWSVSSATGQIEIIL